MKQNITLCLEKDLLQKARILAAKKETSVSKMLSEQLTQIVRQAEQYERAKKSALTNLAKSFHFGGKLAASREELHER